MNINFLFIRHGESCQNLLSSEYSKSQISPSQYTKLFHKLYDPTLSSNGLHDTIKSGEILQNKISNTIGNIDFIGASPMIRAIETAYYMSEKDKTIFVCPYLRESSKNKNTNIHSHKKRFYLNYEPPETMDTINSLNKKFPIKSISEQQEYFLSQNIHNIDYKHVYNEQERLSPGNIEKFLEWFANNIADNYKHKKSINVLIYIHSHVIKNFANDHPSPYNNFGFMLKTKLDNDNNIHYSKHNISLFKPEFIRSDDKCSNPTRCPGICIRKAK